MQRVLKLLAKDGIIQISFSPELAPEHYSRVMSLVHVTSTREDIQKVIEPWAHDHGLTVEFALK